MYKESLQQPFPKQGFKILQKECAVGLQKQELCQVNLFLRF